MQDWLFEVANDPLLIMPDLFDAQNLETLYLPEPKSEASQFGDIVHQNCTIDPDFTDLRIVFDSEVGSYETAATQLQDVVVTGRRMMSDEQIQHILSIYYGNQGPWSGSGSTGGTGGPPPPPVVHVWEEDSDGDGRVDIVWIDNDGDGEIGAGDGASFLDNGPWNNLNAYQFNSIAQGLQNWAAEMGFDFVRTVGAAAVGAAARGDSVMQVSIRAGAGFFAAGEVSWMMHKLIIATLGNIDVAGSNEIQAAGYANWFGVYNPYTNGDGGNSGGGDGRGEQDDPQPEQP